MTNEYKAESIIVLKGLEAVKKRPAMYIGDTGYRGLHHIFQEVVDNSIDEAMTGYCKKIEIKLNNNGSITVKDDGRGIPVDIHPEEKRPAVELVMTVLHAGGKFDHKTYQVSGGLHGVGVSVTNALSEWLEVKVSRDGNIYKQRYEKGKKVSELEIVGKSEKTGTEITFMPDKLIFESVEFDFEVISKRAMELAFLNAGLEIVVENEKISDVKTFKYDGGIVEFVKYLNRNKELLFQDPIYISKENNIQLHVSLQYNNGYQSLIHSFCNNINTVEGGVHEIGFLTSLTRTINDYIKRKKGTKVLVLQPLIELGNYADAVHEKIGQMAADICDHIILTNINWNKAFLRGVDQSKKKEIKVQIAGYLPKIESGVILFEGKEAEKYIK